MAKARILQTGETDIASTDIWRYVLHEGYPTQKVASSGKETVSFSTEEEYKQIIVTHSLGYVPKVKVSGEVSSGKVMRFSGSEEFQEENFSQRFYTYTVSSTQLTITVGYYMGAPGERSFEIYYVILRDD